MFRIGAVHLLGGGAALLGLLWASRARFGRVRQSKAGLALPDAPSPGRQLLTRDDVAKADAFRDLGDDGMLDLDAETGDDPDDIDRLEVTATVGALEHAAVPDEPYDALDTEDVGATWLERATQAGAPTGPAMDELFEGSHVIEPGLGDDEPLSTEYGPDQQGTTGAPDDDERLP